MAPSDQGTPAPGDSGTLAGKLLVAEPSLIDPNFHRSVVYLIDHGPDGALGVVLNRPSPTAAREVVPSWAPYVSDPAVVFTGGPVSPRAAVCLGYCPQPSDSELWRPLDHGIGVVDLNGDPSDAPPLRGLRVFAGYSGWSAGQLETELAMDGWFVLDAEGTDPFTGSCDDLWRSVLRRQPGELRRHAAFADDPRVN